MFIVAVDAEATTEQRDAFTKSIRSKGLGFWHHVAHFWILVDSRAKTSARELRDQLQVIMPTVTVLVMQVSPQTWSGFTPKKSHDWMRKYLGTNKELSLPDATSGKEEP